MAMPMGVPQPPSYQVCPGLCLWGRPSLRATSIAYGYVYGFTPTLELPAMPMTLPTGLSQPQTYQLCR